MAYLGVSTFYKAATLNFFSSGTFNRPLIMHPDYPEHSTTSIDQYKEIIDRNLFKTITRNNQKAEQINIEGLNQTGLDLMLWGTVTSENGPAYAVIQHKDQKTQGLFKEGENIAGAVIKMILKEKVVLRVGSKDEILEMEKRFATDKLPGRKTEFRPVDPDHHIIDTFPKQEIVISRKQIDETIKNVQELMTQAQIHPLFKTDKEGSTGLSISDIRPDSIFRKMGLRDQDIITGIEGKIIESMDDAVDLYQHLKNSDRLNLQVKRRGQTVELDYAIE